MKPEEDLKYDSDFIIDIIPNYVQGRRRGYTDEGTSLIANEVFEEMKKALEKQVPKKPTHAHGNYYCPTCKDTWLLWDDAIPNEHDNFCRYCGQKINWEETP